MDTTAKRIVAVCLGINCSLLCLFLGLKLMGNCGWSWPWVFWPLWLPICFALLAAVVWVVVRAS